MDPIYECEQLFSAARNEFKHLEYFYFHNCVYEKSGAAILDGSVNPYLRWNCCILMAAITGLFCW